MFDVFQLPTMSCEDLPYLMDSIIFHDSQHVYLLNYFHRVSAVSNAQVRGEMYDSGCLGQTGILQISAVTFIFKKANSFQLIFAR